MTVRRTARWDDYWPAWSGDKERLGRLTRIMDGLIEQRREQVTDEVVKSTLNEVEQVADRMTPEEYRSIVGNLAGSRSERARERWSSEMTATEPDLWQTLQGEPNNVIEEIDPSFVDRLEIAAPADPTAPVRAVVRMSKSEGCSLEGRGNDPAWVSSAGDALVSEIKRGVPRWGWLRWPRAGLLYFIVAIPITIALLRLLAALLSVSNESQSNQDSSAFLDWLLGTVVIAFPSLWIAGGISWLARRVLPGFEITPAGGTPRGMRVLGFIGGLVLSFLLSIAANMATATLID
jgi:hypothetical protein